MGYEVFGNVIIEFEAEDNNEWFTVRHDFGPRNEIGKGDIIKLSRALKTFSSTKKGLQARDSEAAQEEFWDKHVRRVEGYTGNGKDLMEFPDWKKLLPITQKLAAVDRFDRVMNAEKEDRQKGPLETSSAE